MATQNSSLNDAEPRGTCAASVAFDVRLDHELLVSWAGYLEREGVCLDDKLGRNDADFLPVLAVYVKGSLNFPPCWTGDFDSYRRQFWTCCYSDRTDPEQQQKKNNSNAIDYEISPGHVSEPFSSRRTELSLPLDVTATATFLQVDTLSVREVLEIPPPPDSFQASLSALDRPGNRNRNTRLTNFATTSTF